MKPYKAYKETGIDWLPRIPAHWKMERAKKLFFEQDIRSTTGAEELLSVSHITGITPRSEKNVTMFEAESTVGYKLCCQHDIVANTMWTWQGAIGVSQYNGIVSPAYNVYRQREKIFNSSYLDFLLREPHLVKNYWRLSTGLRPSRLRLYPSAFLNIRLPIPSMEEQQNIIAYLGESKKKIDQYIATKQK